MQKYYSSWLYASPTVLKEIDNLIKAVKGIHNGNMSTDGKKILTRIITAIRKDIGTNSNDFPEDFFTFIEEKPASYIKRR